MASLEDKVYRLRDIPADRDRLGVAELIKPFIPDGKLEDITIASLAPTCGFPGRSPTKTATVTVRKTPEIMNNSSTTGEWKLCTPALTNPLILDATFYGLTPLNEVEEHQHKYDCIVISGLASHPMGSWQPRGDDKSYMWIRDTLPQLVPGVRFILYGYDTKLMGSKSFQNVKDLAVGLINQLKAGGWTAVNSKELIFLAHSLGGVVLKQCLYMLADSDAAFQSILDKTKGGIFFGVPSEGMNIQDIEDMLKDQPNRDGLVAEISSNSSFLSSLEERISGITGFRKMRFFWAYETQMTSTLESVNGTYRRSGPGTIMVSPQSATGNRCNSDPISTIPINEDHSKMVKFSVGNHMIDAVADKLREILGNDQHGLDQDLERLAASNFQARASTSQGLGDIDSSDTRDPSEDPDFWYIKSIIKSLRAPERDKRLSQIDKRAGHSFEWAFEDPSVGLTEWLQKGDGLYWISGRPASGKSTFMKFLYNDKRTKQMLRHWYSKGKQHVEANFFFHYRGNLIQKSFEGLLRSILSQILEQAPASFSIIQPLFQHRYRQLINEQSLGSLYQDLEETIVTHDERLSSEMKRKLHAISACEMPEKLFHTIFVEPLRTSNGASIDWQKIEKIIFPCREQLLEILRQAKLLEAKPPVYLPKWNKKTSHRFFSLLFQWLEKIDLKSNLLRLKGLSSYLSNNDSATLTPTEEKIIQDVQDIMHRYHEREKIRQFVQNEPWASPKLQQALFEIIHQRSINLEVCLFIDALDEHDGSPEFIVEFLKDITRKKKKSRTRLKILFSSRPWDIFMTAFGDRPGFRIHDHTENDIRELCIHIIQTECPHSQELLELIEEIVKRSNGVFLWAKLVLQDLTKIAVGAPGSDTGNLSSKLQDTLRSLPSDLIEYYRTIVERIPMSFRREVFCLLEVLAKRVQAIYLHDVPLILNCLRFSDFSARDYIRQKSANPNIRTLESLLRTHAGGFIEIYGPKNGLFKSVYTKLQLMHQTTIDFIQLPEFKSIILESGEQAMNDNGFTFLAKFNLLRWSSLDNDLANVKNRFYRYANNAERTTGKSLYSFFLRNHSNARANFHPSLTCYSSTRVYDFSSDIIEMAFRANLRLFIRDYLQANPSILSQTTACCAGNVFDSFKNNAYSQEEAIQTIDFLASKSFQFRRHADCLADALLDLRINRQNYDSYNSVLQSITRNFTGTEPVVNPPRILDRIIDSSAIKGLEMHAIAKETLSKKPSLLHISSLNITKDLLARKANPNMQDVNGNTPLDGYTSKRYAIMFCPHEYHYQLMVVLAQNGGRLNSSTRKQWEAIMTEFESKGFDISIFEQLKFPKWIPKE
ncbi:uncharacterized protein TRIVIDRAFT_10289, partial [Trichoderma virens Gv29-8]